MKKRRITIEYQLFCSASSLFRALSTSPGLKEWFAEKVEILNNVYRFYWNRVPANALLIHFKENQYIRFRWEEDPNYYFEFRINQHELTGDISLIVIDFVDDVDYDDAIVLWNLQIGKLKRSIGCPKK